MAKIARLTDVLRAKCAGDGAAALASFDSLARLSQDYPDVAAALEGEVEYRRIKPAAALAMARQALAEMIGEPNKPEEKSSPAA